MKPIEAVARQIYDAQLAIDDKGPVTDRSWESMWANPQGITQRLYRPQAVAAIAALADNISDEAVKAFSHVRPAHYFPLSKWQEDTRKAIAAAIRSLAQD
jgi:hypothetical protein